MMNDNNEKPEGRNNSENSFQGEMKDDIQNFYKGVKDGISGRDDQEKMRNLGRKSVKFTKCYIIVRIAIFVLVTVVVITIIVLALKVFSKTGRFIDGVQNEISNSVGSMTEATQDKIQTEAFNAGIEAYSGTQSGLIVYAHRWHHRKC